MTATCAPIISSLSMTTGWRYQLNCSAKFGDSFCTINKNAPENRVNGTATGGNTSTLIDTASLTQADDYWTIGFVFFDTGANAGVSRKVKNFVQATHTITFDYGLPFTVSPGDTYHVIRGCDKRLLTCQNAFNNDANYHGFHAIPLTST